MGFNRAGEVYDPLIHGESVGQVIGPATFLPGRGIQLNTGTSYVKYLLAQTITNGEFSMDVEGLRGNGPGDKAKVFGMQEGQDDFITNRYRVDIQYRGSGGFPPNAITFRALYGSGEDLKVRYEPDTTTRFNSVFALNPSTTYHWKAVWGSEFRLVVLEGGASGAQALQRRDGVTERRLRAESTLCVSRSTRWQKRDRVGLDCRDDLSERVDCEPSAAGNTRQRTALKPLYLLSLESSERLCYSD